MSLEEFKEKVRGCRRAIEVDLAVNAWFPHLVGTPGEYLAALEYADSRLIALAAEASGEGAVGCKSAEPEFCGV